MMVARKWNFSGGAIEEIQLTANTSIIRMAPAKLKAIVRGKVSTTPSKTISKISTSAESKWTK